MAVDKGALCMAPLLWFFIGNTSQKAVRTLDIFPLITLMGQKRKV
jgi:hypothetical protein